MENSEADYVPSAGNWPVDPQEEVPLSKDRIWVDGCFDFSHHGHAGAMLQARRLGKELLVGIHSDEAILEHKGPTVMTLQERVSAVDACRWSTQSVPQAPYVTSLPWISHYGCHFVVHGDDITSDSSGEDCYRFVKAAGRFLVVKRTPGISTTDLVGRMLLCTRTHFIRSLTRTLAGQEGLGNEQERKAEGLDMLQRIKDYATDETGLAPGPEVWCWDGSEAAATTNEVIEEGALTKLVDGKPPRPGQHVVYVDGGFDLFSSGHIAFLREVVKAEKEGIHARNWYSEENRATRIKDHGEDYGPLYVIAGVHDDHVINHWKGVNYPIMNIFERGLCVLQCRVSLASSLSTFYLSSCPGGVLQFSTATRCVCFSNSPRLLHFQYIHAVIFSAPFAPSEPYLNKIPYGLPTAVYHGPTAFMPLTYDPYTIPRAMGIFKEIGGHDFQGVNAGEIVQRIMKSREMYEERQRVKGVKGITEDSVRKREDMEREAETIQRERATRS
ncbi:MAG: hypothetical protein M1837_000861 [Sclerophora amabilis]|nr:MAG: hypothetical protein M1837_000861 [Sclerophora amabilis]